MATDDWTFFFSGRNYVKIGFGGNVTTGKKTTVVWPAMFFSGFKLQPEKNTTGKKAYSRPAVSWKLEKITSGKKVSSSLGKKSDASSDMS